MQLEKTPFSGRNLSGARYGKVTVVKYAGTKARVTKRRRNGKLFDRISRQYFWTCQCDCGTMFVSEATNIKSEKVKSCGCYRPKARKVSGLSKSAEYNIWRGMLRRCADKTSARFRNYGSRGIVVCKRWHLFEYFLADMGKRPTREHSLDRINNNGDYEPGNVRWATKLEQDNNRRTNRFVTFNGETLTIANWSRRLGIASKVISTRLQRGWTVLDALTKKPERHVTRQMLANARLPTKESLAHE